MGSCGFNKYNKKVCCKGVTLKEIKEIIVTVFYLLEINAILTVNVIMDIVLVMITELKKENVIEIVVVYNIILA